MKASLARLALAVFALVFAVFVFNENTSKPQIDIVVAKHASAPDVAHAGKGITTDAPGMSVQN